MEVTFLGVGEAFDERLPNTSILVQTEIGDRDVTILLDCGYSVPQRFWQIGLEADRLDAIWLSHFHADHYFGLPPLLVRFLEENRQKGLTILGQKGVKSSVKKCLDLAYPNFYKKLIFPVDFIEVEPGEPTTALDLTWSTALMDHPQRNLALRLEDGKSSLFYSGDGRPTEESQDLASCADLIIHETFGADVHGHGTVAGCLDMVRACKGVRLALVHIKRQVRKEKIQELRKKAASEKGCQVLIPEPGDRLTI